MSERMKTGALVVALSCAGLCAPGCTGDNAPGDEGQTSWEALMTDGDPMQIAPGAMRPMPPPPGPPVRRSVLSERRLQRLAAGVVDVRRLQRIEHRAGRHGVHVHSSPGVSLGQRRLRGRDRGRRGEARHRRGHRLVARSAGLRVRSGADRGRLHQPDKITGTQSIARKRFEGSSSFVLGIDGRKLVLALKLTNGKTVGVSAGGLAAGRFTHVAATYDGKDAILYVDGAAVAKTHAVGKIAPGAGPIFIGNDANGRLLKGVVDSVWLNTLAAPAAVIKELTCVRQPPVVTLSPAMSAPQVAGATVPYDLSITNGNGASCAASEFQFFTSVFPPLSTDSFFGSITVASGATGHATVNVKSSRGSFPGSFPFQVQVFEPAGMSAPPGVRERDLRRRDGSHRLRRLRPALAADHRHPVRARRPVRYLHLCGAGLVAPTVTPVIDPNTFVFQAMQVSANPGVPSDANSSFLGFGLGFGNPPCLDASAFNAIQFTVTGDLGTCQLGGR